MNRRKFLKTVAASATVLGLPFVKSEPVKGKTVEIRCGKGKRLVTLLPIDLKPRPHGLIDPVTGQRADRYPNAYIDVKQAIMVLDETKVCSLTHAHAIRFDPYESYADTVAAYQHLFGIPDSRVIR